MDLARPGTRLSAGLACLATVAALQLGCVGLVGVARGTGEYAIEAPVLTTPAARLSDPTGADVRRELGEPDAIQSGPEGKERWVYRTGLRWHGAGLLLLVVPVPLLVPTGRNEATVHVRDGQVIAVRGRSNTTLARVGCLLLSGPLFGRSSGCFAEGFAPPPAVLRRGHGALRPAAGPRPARSSERLR